jgi:ribose-phosphate pyrophosphokinase
MTGPSCIHAFERDLSPASALAGALGVPVRPVALHRFPDGESLVRIATEDARPVLYCRLDRPNERLIEALLAADALGGKPVLVAPYLPYMRQDIAFHPGEAVSQRVVTRLLGGAVAALVTVAPHLHRTAALDPLVAPAQAIVIPAADVLAPLLCAEAADRPVLVGPDGESAPALARLAELTGLDALHLTKIRSGDRQVVATLPPGTALDGRRAVLIDDICSTGTTLIEAAQLLYAAGAGSVEAVVIHPLFDAAAASRLRAAGITRIRATDSVAHEAGRIALAPLLAAVLREYLP